MFGSQFGGRRRRGNNLVDATGGSSRIAALKEAEDG